MSDPTSPVPAVPVPEEERPDGATLIATERLRQIEKEGWTPDHDDGHDDQALVAAASCYLEHALGQIADAVPAAWPWAPAYWKPKEELSNLVRAGALIAAEIDRINSTTPTPPDAGTGTPSDDGRVDSSAIQDEWVAVDGRADALRRWLLNGPADVEQAVSDLMDWWVTGTLPIDARPPITEVQRAKAVAEADAFLALIHDHVIDHDHDDPTSWTAVCAAAGCNLVGRDSSREAAIAAWNEAHDIPTSAAPSGTTGATTGGPCGCSRCWDERTDLSDVQRMCHGMFCCSECGNKRCPKATDHRHDCTDSNEPGQAGSAYAAAPPAPKRCPECGLLLTSPVAARVCTCPPASGTTDRGKG